MGSLTSLYGGGGGAGAPVNSIARLAVGGQTLYTDESGGVWLKTGNVIDADAATYPDSIVSPGIDRTEYDTSFYDFPMQNTNGLTFNSDGTRVFLVSDQYDNVYQYNLSTAFEINTANSAGSFSVANEENQPKGLDFNSDGSKMYVLGRTNDTVYQYNLSTPFQVTTATYSNISFSISSQTVEPRGFRFKSDGTKMYVMSTSGIFQYSLSTAFDISTASYDNINEIIYSTAVTDINFNSDGSKMYLISAQGYFLEYDLSTPYDITSYSYVGRYNTTAQINNPFTLAFNNNRDKVYITGGNNVIYQYDLLGDFMGLPTDTGTYDYIKLK